MQLSKSLRKLKPTDHKDLLPASSLKAEQRNQEKKCLLTWMDNIVVYLSLERR